MKRLFILLIICSGFFKAQAQQVSFFVQGDADDWQLYMSSKVMDDLNSAGKTVFITLTAGDEGYGNTTFNGSAVPYFTAREKGAVYAAKFAYDIVPGSVYDFVPAAATASINGHSLVKYVYKNTVSYFLRLPDGNTDGSGFAATGNVSLKKLKDAVIASITSVDGSNTYNGWNDLTGTIEAIINVEKGANSQVWLNTSNLNVVTNPNDHADHIYSSTAAQDAVNTLSWVGINEFINNHSSNLAANLSTSAFQNASGIFGLTDLALVENKYSSKFDALNKAWLPMDYFTVKRSPSACAAPTALTSSAIANTSATVSWTAAAGAISYDVDYKLNTASTWTNAATATTATAVNIIGLTQGTLYDWRVRTTCSIGNGSYIVAQFTTTEPATCNTPSGLTTSNITVTAATVNWLAVSGAANYDVEYKLASASTWTLAATATTAVSLNISGLTETSLYDWRVRANCTAVGLSSAYALAQFTTATAGTCNAPASLASTNVTTSAATVSWGAVSGAANYTVEYKLASASTWTTAVAATTATTRNLTGLTNASTYDWRVRANCTAIGLSSAYTQAQFTTQTTPSQPVSFSVQGDADDWQLFMSSRLMADLSSGGKVVFITLTAGDEGNGNTAFNGSALPYYLAREKGAVYSAKFASDILPGSVYDFVPSSETVSVNGHNLVKYVYKNTVTYFLRLPDGNADGNGYAATGNVSLKKLKEAAIASITSVDGSNTYTGWGDLTGTIEAIINAEKGTNTQTWLNVANLDVVTNPNDHADHIYSSTAAQDAVNTLSWVGINEFINNHSSNLSANLSTSAFQNASGIFGIGVMALVENKYTSKFDAVNKAWLPMDYYTIKRSPSACASPTALSLSVVNTTAASVSWTAAIGALSYDVDYKLSTASTWTNVVTATTSTLVNINDLTQGTLYNWRVRTNCSSGSGSYVSSQFTTTVPPSCAAPTGLSTTNITATGATANWAAVSGAASYDLDYKLSSSPDWINAITGTTATSFVGTGLTQSSVYDWRVRANCTAVGLTSSYSQSQFTTLTPPSCNTPAGLSATSIALTSATVNWGAVSGAANYTVEYKLASSGTWIVAVAATTTTSRSITGLVNSSVYDWRVRANCTAVGLSSAYAQAQFATITPSCSAPSGLTTTNITLTGATLNWAAVSGAANYTVEYKLASSATWITSIASTTALSRSLTGLAHSSIYDWRVRANCTAVGLSSSYTQGQFTTVIATCSAPTGLTTTNITLTGATVSWAAVSGAANYVVEYKLATSATWTVLTSTTAVTRNLTGLAHSSVYDWRVKSNCTAVGLTSSYSQGQFTTVIATCGAPSGLTTTNVTSTNATLNWTAVSGAANYRVEYKLASSSTWTVSTSSTTALTRNISGLTGAFLYDWRVRANCTAVGLTSTYAQTQFTTVCTDILETNETYSAAKSISVNRFYTAKIATAADKDYYRFTNSLTALNMRVTLTNLPADYDLKLYTPLGALINTSENRGNADEEIIYNPFLTTGTYRIYVYGYNSAFSNTGCYTLRVDLSSTPFTSNNFAAGPIESGVKGSEQVNAALPNLENKEEKFTTFRGGMKVYPVPASSVVTVSFDAYTKGNATIVVNNQLGQEVMRKTVGVDNGINVTSLNVSNLKSGVYLVRVNNGTDVQTQRLLIAR